jgi:hypothetical protein
MRKSGARGAPGQRHDARPDRTAQATTPEAPNAGETTHRPAYGIVEELQLRQSMCKVFSGSENSDHSALCRAQKRVS